jgi:chaperonin cofactor prefoldin
LGIVIERKKTNRVRGFLNRVVSSRVDAQLNWRDELLEKRMQGLEEPIAKLQRLITEMSASIGSRLTALEAAALEDRKKSS